MGKMHYMEEGLFNRLNKLRKGKPEKKFSDIIGFRQLGLNRENFEREKQIHSISDAYKLWKTQKNQTTLELLKDRLRSESGKGPTIAKLGLGTLLGVGTIKGVDALAGYLGKAGKNIYFNKILDKNPELADSEKREKVKELFDSLFHLNPEVAKDPIAAGTFIKNQLELGMGVPISVSTELMKSRGKKQDTSKDILSKYLLELPNLL